MDIGSAIEVRNARQREQQQAVARPTRLRFFAFVTGTGTYILQGPDRIMFHAWMLEEPTFSFGLTIMHEKKDDIDEPPNVTELELPEGTATVLRYHKNVNGVYLSADVGFRVFSPHPVKFSLTWEGFAMSSYIPEPDE